MSRMTGGWKWMIEHHGEAAVEADFMLIGYA
jgi:hypothetical protein